MIFECLRLDCHFKSSIENQKDEDNFWSRAAIAGNRPPGARRGKNDDDDSPKH
jgi:hypothetical protein